MAAALERYLDYRNEPKKIKMAITGNGNATQNNVVNF
jgi:Holliday junction resolvasome RuvABC endonuclease subunit